MKTNVTVNVYKSSKIVAKNQIQGWDVYTVNYNHPLNAIMEQGFIVMPPDVNPIDLEQALNILIQGGLRDVRW
jgi:hypothetical protein